MKNQYVWIFTGKGIKESKRYELINTDISTAEMTCKDISTNEIKTFSRSQLDLFSTINKGLQFE